MADWDDDSPRLRKNLVRVLRNAREHARRREVPRVEDVRQWHRHMMAGLQCDGHVGRFRGEPGLEMHRVGIGTKEGTPPGAVVGDLAIFEQTLQRVVAALDRRFPVGRELDADGLRAVVDLCAWAHAEWVRIHPFDNGNGRTARGWANVLLMRYGLPPAIRLRPRPGDGYGPAGASAMDRNWRPTAAVFWKLLEEFAG